MAISGQQVASSSTLETLRTQFNNLVTDVAAIERTVVFPIQP